MFRLHKKSDITSLTLGAARVEAGLRLVTLLVAIFSLSQPLVNAQESPCALVSLPAQSTDGTFDPRNISPLIQLRSPWELTNPQPLPDDVVKNSIEPLVWVKIPKGFAGVWETRKKLIQILGENQSLNDMPLSPGEIADYVKRDRLEPFTNVEFFRDPTSELSGLSVSIGKDHRPLSMLNDQYLFLRGMQVDEEGNIWDCPSLRNIEFHKALITPFHTITKTLFISDRKQSAISDKELAEEFTINIGDYLREWNYGLDREKIRAERHLVNDSFVDARFFRTSDYDLRDVIEYIPEHKVGDFKPIDNWRGIDVKASFNAFRKGLHQSP